MALRRMSLVPWAIVLTSFILMESSAYLSQTHSSISRLDHASTLKEFGFRWRRKSSLSALANLLGSDSVLGDVQFEMHPSIGSIPAEAWDSCLTRSSSPFVEHAWLRCLEESKCASTETGWVAKHVSIRIDGQLRGFVPLYLKGHSMGEFIFDSGWADAAHANGIDYYPKLLVGIPFTPATGNRILLHPSLRKKYSKADIGRLRRLLASFLKQVARSNKISSVHMNFLTEDEATDITDELKVDSATEDSLPDKVQAMFKRLKYVDKDDYLRRTSLQYHWTNCNAKNGGKPYKSFEDYLTCFKSKRRITIRRERRRVSEDEDIQIDAVVGKDILKYEGLVERMFDIYLSTVGKMLWGRQYLTLEFFQLLAESEFIDNLCFMCARRRTSGEPLKAKDVFAGTFNIVKNGVFYGRYWGCLSEVKNLHFETCYWSSIEYCIKNGLKRMEPGAGGGDYKWARGFDPATIHSAHYICHPGLRRAVKQFLDYETENNVELTEYLMQRSVVGSGSIQ